MARCLAASRPTRWTSRQELDLYFHRTIRRHVRADCTVSVDGVRYEVTPNWSGHTVELRAPLEAPTAWTLFVDGTAALVLKPLDPVDNDRRTRRAAFARRDQESA